VHAFFGGEVFLLSGKFGLSLEGLLELANVPPPHHHYQQQQHHQQHHPYQKLVIKVSF